MKNSYNYKALVKVRKSNGDLEGTVREIWRGGKGVELPGEEDDEKSMLIKKKREKTKQTL